MTSFSAILNKPANVLLIEDDKEVSDAIAGMLRDKGFHCSQCFNGREGLLASTKQNLDLILLDKMLPELDGFELLRRLRKHRDTPVLVLSACGSEQDRIEGLSGGADDYLPKPFNKTELELRIHALLRRSRISANPVKTLEQIVDGDIMIETRHQKVSVASQVVELTPIEYELLRVFIEQSGEVLSKPYLYQLVLNKPFRAYDRSLDMHISNLRSKLSLPADHRQIHTIRGQGYCYK
ncbi:MAG: response regulator transcription factor [Pontibacterium sp.]